MSHSRREKDLLSPAKPQSASRPWWVYVLRCADGSLYCGITTDVQRRVRQHNAGKGAKYIRGRTPASVAVAWQVENKSQALREEHEFKALTKKEKESFVGWFSGELRVGTQFT